MSATEHDGGPKGWIPLERRKPPYHTDVLVLDHTVCGESHIEIGMLLEGHQNYYEQWIVKNSPWVDTNGPIYHRVTHWMPLPEKP